MAADPARGPALSAAQQRAGLAAHWPPELRGLRSYLPYRLVARPSGRLGKVPCRLAGGRLYPVDPGDSRHRLEFGAALALFEAGHCAGIGIALDEGIPVAGGLPLVAVDLDGVVRGSALDPAAQEILVTLGETYTEISPSGSGIHALALGPLPVRGRRGVGLELISSGFLAATGCPLPGSVAELRPCGVGLAALHARVSPPAPAVPSPSLPGPGPPVGITPANDAAVLRRARRSRTGRRFARLYSGDLSLHGGDHSRADLALLRLLAHHTTDPHQLERLFQSSALYRPTRWIQRAGADGLTYGQRTLATALQPLTSTTGAP